jgi:uncharacterized protein YcbK (DUF882 family)
MSGVVKLPDLERQRLFEAGLFTVKLRLRVLHHIARQQDRRHNAPVHNKQSRILRLLSSSLLRFPKVRLGKAVTVACAGVMMAIVAVRPTQDVVAQGGTRSLTIYHAHTKEQETITFKSGGSYDSAGLQKLNWLLRDWRQDEPTRMDPQLFDILWEVYRASGSSAPIHVVSAYRSPGTNAMLARRSRGVAKSSQHMSGRAMDFNLPDVSMARVRDIGLRMQNGGVGYYPRANNPWVHLDTGGVRHWPKISRDHLVRLFPDEKTVHIPSDGKPLAGFEAARSIIEARGGSVSSGYIDIAEGRATGKTLFQILFGGGEGDDEGDVVAGARGKKGRTAVAARSRNQQVAALPPEAINEGSAVAFFNQNTSSTSTAPAQAAAIRPRTPARPTPLPEPAPAPVEVKREEAPKPVEAAPKPVEIAALAPKVPTSTKADEDNAGNGRWVNIPLPQRRPQNFAPTGPVLVNIPLPQRRPATLLAALPATTDEDRTAEAPRQDEQKPVQTAALGKPVSVPLPPQRPANLPSPITAGLRTGAPVQPAAAQTAAAQPAAVQSSAVQSSAVQSSAVLAFAPAQPAARIIPAAPAASAAIDRQGMNSLISQIATASNPARGNRVAPQSIAAVAEVKTVTGHFESAPAAPKSDGGGFTGSAIRPLGQGFKRAE